MSEHIRPGFCADSTRQFIRWVDGEAIDVTCMSRTDTNWRHVDSRGHVHCWYEGEQPAKSYRPSRRYHLPTLTLIVDYPEADDYPAVTHYECSACRSLDGAGGVDLNG
jgi:hypothetical protein